MAAEGGPADTARVILRLGRGGEAISGTFADEHGVERSFWGWLELSAALDRTRGVDAGIRSGIGFEEGVSNAVLPDGGGAIRGIDEKLTVNQPSGPPRLTVPVVTSPGRQGSGPKLALSDASGAGRPVQQSSSFGGVS